MKTAEASSARGHSQREYQQRVHRVIAYIDEHLDQPLQLDTLASVAHFSPFHFHRLFTALCGETLGDYLRRRRLEHAALRLASQPRLAVLQVALAVGFGSGEAFARAFNTQFGHSPSAWRQLRKADQLLRKLDQAGIVRPADHQAPVNSSAEARMHVTLIDLAPTPVAYFRYTGPYGEPVSRFWMEQVAPWLDQNNLFGQVRYGIAHDDPAITDAAKCRYDACVELAADAVVSGSPMRTTLQGGRHACLPFEGTAADIDAAWQRLLRDWLPRSGLQLDSRPLLEHYPIGARFDAGTGAFDCRLCIPVSAL